MTGKNSVWLLDWIISGSSGVSFTLSIAQLGYDTMMTFALNRFFDAVVSQNASELAEFFEPDATIIWPNTDEQFTGAEYVRANCEYPGHWQGVVEKVLAVPSPDCSRQLTVISQVTDTDSDNSYRAVSFLYMSPNGLVQTLTEYWGDITPPPRWRQQLNIGKRIETSPA